MHGRRSVLTLGLALIILAALSASALAQQRAVRVQGRGLDE